MLCNMQAAKIIWQISVELCNGMSCSRRNRPFKWPKARSTACRALDSLVETDLLWGKISQVFKRGY